MAVTPPTHHVGAIDCLKVVAFKRGLDIYDTCAPEMEIQTLLRQIESILGCIYCTNTKMKKYLQNLGQTVCVTTMTTVLADTVLQYLPHHQNHHHHHSNHHHHHHHHDNLHHCRPDPSREVAAE